MTPPAACTTYTPLTHIPASAAPCLSLDDSRRASTAKDFDALLSEPLLFGKTKRKAASFKGDGVAKPRSRPAMGGSLDAAVSKRVSNLAQTRDVVRLKQQWVRLQSPPPANRRARRAGTPDTLDALDEKVSRLGATGAAASRSNGWSRPAPKRTRETAAKPRQPAARNASAGAERAGGTVDARQASSSRRPKEMIKRTSTNSLGVLPHPPMPPPFPRVVLRRILQQT